MKRNSLEHELIGGLVGLYILAIIIAAWAAFKAIEMVLRVMVAHPDNRWLWTALGVCLVSIAVVVITQGQFWIVDTAAGLATATLLILCKGVEIYHDQLFQRQMSREMMVDQVLTEPWFSLS